MKKDRIIVNCFIIFAIIFAVIVFLMTIIWCVEAWEYYVIDLARESDIVHISLRNALVYTFIDLFSLLGVALLSVTLYKLNKKK